MKAGSGEIGKERVHEREGEVRRGEPNTSALYCSPLLITAFSPFPKSIPT